MNKLKKINTLLFDLDNTLFDFDAASKIALSMVFDKWCIDNNSNSYNEFERISNKLWTEYETGKITQQNLFDRRFRELCDALQVEQNGDAMEADFQEGLCSFVVVIDNALEIIEYLSSFFTIYIITNGNTDTQVARIKKTGLDVLIDGMYTSEQAGSQKPDIKFFQSFFQHFQCTPETCLVIGDSIKTDMLGGKNAGMITCLYDPNSKNCDLSYCDYVIKSYDDLVLLLKNNGVL